MHVWRTYWTRWKGSENNCARSSERHSHSSKPFHRVQYAMPHMHSTLWGGKHEYVSKNRE